MIPAKWHAGTSIFRELARSVGQRSPSVGEQKGLPSMRITKQPFTLTLLTAQ